MTFQREKQSVTASELLQAIADDSEILLKNCQITGMLDINRLFDPAEKFNTQNLDIKQSESARTIVFKQKIVFDNCTFEENTVFSGPWSDPDALAVIFNNDVIFNSSIFKGQARFRSSRFEKTAGFDGCTFNGVCTFKNTVVKGDAKFRTAVFNGYSLFGSVTFESSARFTNTQFVKGVNFADTKFLDQVDFNGVYCSSRALPAYENVRFKLKSKGQDESFWRFVKQTSLDAGYYQLAGECFYKERCASLQRKLNPAEYDNFPPAKKILHLLKSMKFIPEYLLGKLLFGFGERPVRVLGASALVILICAVIFTASPNALAFSNQLIENSFFQSLYFSTITFTTLGYGDLYPATDFVKAVAMTEAVIGGCLIALFVVCLANRFSRG